MCKKGYKQTQEHSKKIGITKIGNTNTLGKHWKLSNESKRRMSIAKIGKKMSLESRQKMSIARSGKGNSSWNGGRRISKDGYINIYSPYHPNCDKRRSVSEHRLVMEKYIGRYLNPNEVIHHKNNIRDDNRIENLELFKSKGLHISFHRKGKPSNRWINRK